MQAFPIPQAWVWGGDTFWLALFSNLHWTDQQGAIHLRGNQSLEDMINEPAQLCPGTVLGRLATVSDFFIEPTVLSIDESKTARITGLLFDENFNYVAWLFKNWIFPSAPNPFTWTDLTRYNHLRSCRIGMSAMDVIHSWFNGINFISPADLARLPTARGTATIAVDLGAGLSQVVVPSVKVKEATSIIRAYSLSENVTGSLYCPRSEYDEGVSFTIHSSVIGDDGEVGWEISEPF